MQIATSQMYTLMVNYDFMVMAYRIPHDNDDVITERPIDVLRGIQVEVVTIVVIEIDTCVHVYM